MDFTQDASIFYILAALFKPCLTTPAEFNALSGICRRRKSLNLKHLMWSRGHLLPGPRLIFPLQRRTAPADSNAVFCKNSGNLPKSS